MGVILVCLWIHRSKLDTENLDVQDSAMEQETLTTQELEKIDEQTPVQLPLSALERVETTELQTPKYWRSKRSRKQTIRWGQEVSSN